MEGELRLMDFSVQVFHNLNDKLHIIFIQITSFEGIVFNAIEKTMRRGTQQLFKLF
jgi:hypothetical protein